MSEICNHGIMKKCCAACRGELSPNEPHPAAYEAKAWIARQPPEELYKWREVFASCAIEGNRLGDVCAETLNRLLNSQPVSDRYLLGLAWTMRAGNWPNAELTDAGPVMPASRETQSRHSVQ